MYVHFLDVVLTGRRPFQQARGTMRAALRVHSWMGLVLLGWALVAHARERVASARPLRLTKKPTPLVPAPAGESAPRAPALWN
jgi:hypothetical protein